MYKNNANTNTKINKIENTNTETQKSELNKRLHNLYNSHESVLSNELVHQVYKYNTKTKANTILSRIKEEQNYKRYKTNVQSVLRSVSSLWSENQL